MTRVRGGDATAAITPRPFYGEFAWAYDYLIERPVGGFEAMEYAGTYEGAPLGQGDRIVVAASLGAR
jgi:hypothetical protein